MRTVTSTDGTPIAVWESGRGPPLLLVHGVVASHATTWRSVRPELERRFTIHAMDRRGRGGSGDADGYDLEREAADVAAVVDAIGGPVSVLGHSFGALCALEAARLTAGISSLILYEGVPLRGSDGYAPNSIEALEALLEAGEVEEMLVRMLQEIGGITEEEIELLRAQRDSWRVRLANASTVPRELRADRGYVFDADRFREVRARTLLLVGEESPPREHANAWGVANALTQARVRVLPGQQHVAMYTAPERFVEAVVEFLS